MKKIVIAPQAFKNCATAGQVARAISCGVQRALPDADVVSVPIADGGDGTLEILLNTLKGKRFKDDVHTAFHNVASVEWGVINGESPTAIIETALICGMGKVLKENLNPMTASTYGVGEMIKKILDRGHKNIFVGLGGSATNDGGAGVAQALGIRLLDEDGRELPRGGGALIRLAHIETKNVDKRLKDAHIIVGCDVNSPLLGPKGATNTYSRQKGATPDMVKLLEKSLTRFAAVASDITGVDMSTVPYGGAAGGMASGLHLFCQGQLVGGASWIMDKIGMRKILQDADLLIVAEGKMDAQTASDKGPMVAAKIAQSAGIPVIAIVGTVGSGGQVLKKLGIDAVYPASPKGSQVPDNALVLLERAAEKALKKYQQNRPV